MMRRAAVVGLILTGVLLVLLGMVLPLASFFGDRPGGRGIGRRMADPLLPRGSGHRRWGLFLATKRA